MISLTRSLRIAPRRSALLIVTLAALSSACGPADDDDPLPGATVTAGGGGMAGDGGSGATAGSGGSGTAGNGSGGDGAATPHDNNPDGLPEASSPIYSRDYEAEDAADVVNQPSIAVGEWGADYGHGPSGGWRFVPDPIVDPTVGANEDSAGWAGGLHGQTLFPLDAYHLVTVSYLFRISQALVDEIALGGAFWAHDQKSIDFKYHDPNAPYGEGHRNTIHFGESEGQVRLSHVDGGGGSRIYFGPDWTTLADEWVWLCHVIDMRSASPAERYVATYLKREGDAGVTRIGIRYENGTPELQPYDGRGIWGFLSPIHGYWDDMVDRNGLTHDLAEMSLSVDRLRVMPGWPDATHGPPF